MHHKLPSVNPNHEQALRFAKACYKSTWALRWSFSLTSAALGSEGLQSSLWQADARAGRCCPSRGCRRSGPFCEEPIIRVARCNPLPLRQA